MDRNDNYPHGYLLELDKFLRIPHASFNAYKGLMESYKAKYGKGIGRANTFGDFDLIGIQAIDNFPEYRQNASQSYTWLGNQQSILLTPIAAPQGSQKRRFGYYEPLQKHGLNLTIDGRPIEAPFFCVSLLYVSSRTRARFCSYSRFLERCQDAISRIVDCYNREAGTNVVCEVFGTFSFSELAILWSADQFVDILALADLIWDLSFVFDKTDHQRAFNSSYSIISILEANLTEEKISALKGAALVQCSVKETGGNKRNDLEESVRFIKKILKKKLGKSTSQVRFCAGEHDLIFNVSLVELCALFASGEEQAASLQNMNPHFQEHIEKTVTRLYYRSKDVKTLTRAQQQKFLEIPVDEKDTASGIPEFSLTELICCDSCIKSKEHIYINQRFDEIRRKVQRISPPMSSILSTFDLLYSDYIQCVSSANDEFWLHDFHVQFSAALDMVETATALFFNSTNQESANKEKVFSEEAYLNTLRQIFEIVSIQINHIADTGRPYLDVTRSHFTRMEQVDLTLHAYYGIVKEIIHNIYQNAGEDQSQLVPLITFKPMAQVKSKLFFYNPLERNLSKARLINIELPYDVWSFFHYHIPLLVHELYHYTAPLCRELRNYTVGMLSVYHTTVEMVVSVLNDIQLKSSGSIENLTLDLLSSLISEILWTYILSQSSNLSQAIPGMKYNGKEKYLRQVFSGVLYAWISGKQCNANAFSMRDLWLGLKETINARQNVVLGLIDDGLIKEQARQMLAELLLALQKLAELAQQYAECQNNPSAQGVYDGLALGAYENMLAESMQNTSDFYDVQINELLPDLAMVRLLGMRAEEYLVQYAIYQENSLCSPDDIASRSYSAVRLGTVLDWLLCDIAPSEDAHELYSRFCKLREPFTSLYENACGNKSGQTPEARHTDAMEWFNTFEQLFFNYFELCFNERTWIRCYINDQIMPLLPQKESRLKSVMCTYFKKLKDFSINHGSHFSGVISSIRELQKQPLLRNLTISPANDRTELCQTAFRHLQVLTEEPLRLYPLTTDIKAADFEPPSLNDADGYPLQRTLYNAGELTNLLSELTAGMTEAHKQRLGKTLSGQMIWFRGVKNSKYHLLPSILVNYLKDSNIIKPDSWLYPSVHALQRAKFEHFKYRADGAPEIINTHRYTKIDYLALMQHYAQWTTLLDWSEDAFTSLYFALEPYFKDPHYKSTDSSVLYLFDPELYNTARRDMLQIVPKDKTDARRNIEKELSAEIIPNLSIPYNEALFKVFTCSDECVEPRENSYIEIPANDDPGEMTLANAEDQISKLPLAIYTSQLSRRIRAQSGIFLAYNPETLPIINLSREPKEGESPSRAFDYIALDRIQEYYLKSFDNAYPFLRKLIITGDCATHLTKLLKEMGINRYRIYPELEELE